MAWIFLNNAFLSIVDPMVARQNSTAARTGTLLVRARAKGDLERIFPGARVSETPDRDYRFRAFIPRDEVAQAIAYQIAGIRYGNFKSSVEENDRHDAYMKVWSAMFGFQAARERKGAGRGRDGSGWGFAEEIDLGRPLPFYEEVDLPGDAKGRQGHNGKKAKPRRR